MLLPEDRMDNVKVLEYFIKKNTKDPRGSKYAVSH